MNYQDIPRIWIGYDSNETIAYHVLSHSIISNASRPVSITPLMIDQLPMSRPRDEFQSTEFSFSRFLVPWLCKYEGRAIFMDCDMIVTDDICELWDMPMDRTVAVVKHSYQPNMENKFLGQKQSNYPKKNWSSVMLFNNPMCKALTPERVNTASGKYLHQFEWVEYGDVAEYSMIGDLPNLWNHLVGENNQCALKDAKLIHYTRGTPCFKPHSTGEAALLWLAEKHKMMHYNRYGEYSYEASPELRGETSDNSPG